ncbi:hypothetical protein ABT173_08580 [Streptomyces sp. NPDC001795]|uniref:hypothetical protein n=1 Tax=unclassified Streptomyces TaxID=2593676 RepID=UPI00331AC736
MGMKGRIALGAVVGVVVIGAVSANAGKEAAKEAAKNDSGGKGSSASAGQHSGQKSGNGSGTKSGAHDKPALGGDGSYVVGKDVQPGTYRTTGNTDGMCYWERAKDASGDTDSLIANDNVTGTSYVTVKATDKLFKSSGCKDWEAVGKKATGAPSGSRINGDGGMYRVGVDIAPGTYKSTGNSDDQCYWERAKDALHGLKSVAANDNARGSAVVTISAGDAYFKTTGCKDWTKTS